jgi:DNA-binding response OmpR family regulator
MGPSPNSELRHQNQLTVKKNALALIVEDDPATRALEEIVLEADRCAVRTAKNGEEPSGWRRERCPAVILLDFARPIASGFDV